MMRSALICGVVALLALPLLAQRPQQAPQLAGWEYATLTMTAGGDVDYASMSWRTSAGIIEAPPGRLEVDRLNGLATRIAGRSVRYADASLGVWDAIGGLGWEVVDCNDTRPTTFCVFKRPSR